MMTPARTFSYLACITACLLLLAAGCAPGEKVAIKPQVGPQKQIPEVIPQEAAPAVLALKFTPQDSTTYRVVSEAQQSVKWRGAVPEEPAFAGGLKLHRIEMTFTQQIQSIDANGNAVAKITIDSLKYHSQTKDQPPIDFNSTDPNRPRSPLARILGQSYIIEISTTGEVTKIIDVNEAYNALAAPSSPERRIPFAIIEPAAIKERHGTLVLPEPDKNKLQSGDNWSNTKTFSFGPMGSSSYERTYTLKEIKDVNNRELVIVEMNTIPAPEMPQESHGEESDFLDTFDKTGTYTGQLKFDLTSGKVEKYSEKLDSKWSAILPPDRKMTEEPAILVMGAVRLYDLEKID